VGLFRRREPLHEQLARQGGLAADPIEKPGPPGWMETGIHGVPRAREWDTVVTVEAEGVEGESARFVALHGDVLVVEEGEDVEPLAHAVDQVATIERERNALSLALDTERMISADLRGALTSAERRLAETTGEIDALRAEALASIEGTGLPADGMENLTELTFDEDNSGAIHEDGAITIEEEGWESVRLSTRYSFTARIDVKVNGTAAVLTDLSVTGCGVHTSLPLQTGQSVRVQLPGDPHPLLCPGEVVWVRKDSPAGKGSGGIRAGIQFTQSDEAAIEAFIIMRADV